MQIFLVSGNGIGAGKTSLAKRLAPTVLSLGDYVRHELALKYPAVDWYNRSQEYKDKTKVRGTSLTVRQMLVRHGEEKCAKDPLHYARQLAAGLVLADRALATRTVVAIDDLRKQVELEYLRQEFPDVGVHFHIISPLAIPEPQYDGQWLHEAADYVVLR